MKGCDKWKHNSIINRLDKKYLGFPASTLVQTRKGPKPMNQLTIGDSLFGIDPQSSIPGFSPIEAWLQHDPHAEADFDTVLTDNGARFESSALQNFAFVRNNKIDYKFARDLTEGEQLVSFPERGARVTGRESGVRRKGLFAPFTAFHNYFVFEAGTVEGSEARMVLVHALSQVDQP